MPCTVRGPNPWSFQTFSGDQRGASLTPGHRASHASISLGDCAALGQAQVPSSNHRSTGLGVGVKEEA